MYNAYFGFTEKPFTIAPNPKYLFMSAQHQEALAHMLFSLQGEGGFAVLTGEVGTGKTTICRRMLEQLPESTDVAYIINPYLSALEVLANICDEFHIDYEHKAASTKVFTDLINQYVLEAHAQGNHTVVVIDEAQNLDPEVLEQLRLLTNLETNEKKLLQIMLLGQPELNDKLARNDLRQLAQRITARYHLNPLNKNETAAYINHRLAVAGCKNQTLLSTRVIHAIFKHSQGVPRLINLIADRALLGAYAKETKHVTKKILTQAVLEVRGVSKPKTSVSPLWLVALLVVLIGANVVYFPQWFQPEPTTKTQEPTSAKVVVMSKQELSQTAKGSATIALTANALKQDQVNQAEANPTKATEIEPALDIYAESRIKPVTEKEFTTAEPQPNPGPLSETLPSPEPTQRLPSLASQDQAFQAVFEVWGINYQPQRDGSACAFAEQHQLKCFRQRGDIASIRSLDRPVVLSVTNLDGFPAYMSIIQLVGLTATLQKDQQTTQISLAELVMLSQNDFTLLWKTPRGYQEPIRLGQQGHLVSLLAEKVTSALGQTWIGAPRQVYDASLRDQVKIFQRSQGLNPDGVAGPITWIHLNAQISNDHPTLHVSKKAKSSATQI